jgi:DNA recombination protein RmuC
VPDLATVITLPAPYLIVLGTAALAAGLLGWLVARLHAQKRIASLEVTLELERQSANQRLTEMERAFAALSGEALRSNNQTFLQLAEETLKRYQGQARNELAQREKAVENMVKPIKDALEQTRRQIEEVERERREAYGSLHKHLETLTETQQMLHGETRNLVQALRRPEVRGQWGELTLRRLVELAGMVEHCDFVEQEHTRTEAGAVRPDMIIRMPGGREVVVDVKTPLDAYLSAVQAASDEERARHLQHHTRKVRERVRELAGKAYWTQFKHAPDFVVLFIPGDQFLNAALDLDRALLEDALQQKVILATPTSLVALLRAIAYGWRQEALAENAEHIRELGETLYGRLAVFADHLAKLGRSLDSSVSSFNRAVGSFDAKVMPAARKFTEMGLSAKREIPEPQQVERGPREIGGPSD